ncbi:beta-lactamase [Pedobacter antarcticus 4BY]|uniref:Beta-lactamase n=2 Tax=Pedobacter antarcticus TaxID=34086 RepID=A0A081PDV0_9SPHI|nr:MBL fold metallo-hydrolase [Pedobacter antarcticus]KEQ28873.1 beta-lactamase [Pedobacter antarcticus 4BY]SFF01204.1 L-ascorbate metabolism protein UlaG, beta-lactamase superfamily [Pedobacter antarcticus]
MIRKISRLKSPIDYIRSFIVIPFEIVRAIKNLFMIIDFVVFLLICFLLFLIWRLPVFGSLPRGKRLELIKSKFYYKDGSLKNLSDTPVKPENVSYFQLLSALLKKNPLRRPPAPLPVLKPDFTSSSQTRITWFGHSSYLLQISGLNVLVDPVFSPRTSPFSFIGSLNYAGTEQLRLEDLPDIDILLITHDHYDHLDYQSVLKLSGKTKYFLTSLGVGAHLQHWGIPESKITEMAWYETTTLSGLQFTACPARHFTGRLFKRNQTLWCSFVVQSSDKRIFLGGDSGYDTHFKEIGERFGSFDLAILECGQYNVYWPFIHMFPEQTVQAAIDLNAKALLPVHWSKFSLALHDWNDPVIRAVKAAADVQLPIATPHLGETITIGDPYPVKQWWLNLSVAKQ